NLDRLVGRTVCRQRAATAQQLYDAIKGKTATRAEADDSGNLLLTALRTKHGDCSSPTGCYVALDNKPRSGLIGKHFNHCHCSALMFVGLTESLKQQTDKHPLAVWV